MSDEDVVVYEARFTDTLIFSLSDQELINVRRGCGST